MGWLSRLLGEMPEETKYKPSNSFKIKTGKGGITLENYSEKYKSEDAANLFAQSYAKKYDQDDEIASFEKLEEEMENLDKSEKYNLNDVRKTLHEQKVFSDRDIKDLSKVTGIVGMVIAGIFIVIIAMVFLTNAGFGNFPLWIFFLIPFWLFGKKAKGLSKLSK